jgi:TPP-dependent pyruvate/acetoin dehydrogenase alpha subunit
MVTRSKSRAGKRKQAVPPKPPGAERAQPANGGTSPSNQDVLRQLYASMLKCRMLAERAQRLSGKGTHGDDYDFDIGQEAVVVGATVELDSQDTMLVSARNFAAYVARGVSLSAVLSGAATGNGSEAVVVTEPSPGQMAGFDAFNLGTGLALVHKLEKKRNVVIAFCSKETPAPDRWHEALKFAGIHKLPILYVKNASAFELAPEKRTPALEGLSFMARDCGFPAIVVDGKDAVAVWRAVHESIHRARNGAGPTLIECETQLSSAGDPLTHMEHYMKKRGVWDDGWRQETANRIEAEAESLP